MNILQVSARELSFRLQLSLGIFLPSDRISTGSHGLHEANRHLDFPTESSSAVWDINTLENEERPRADSSKSRCAAE